MSLPALIGFLAEEIVCRLRGRLVCRVSRDADGCARPRRTRAGGYGEWGYVERIRLLQPENRELRRANEILTAAWAQDTLTRLRRVLSEDSPVTLGTAYSLRRAGVMGHRTSGECRYRGSS